MLVHFKGGALDGTSRMMEAAPLTLRLPRSSRVGELLKAPDEPPRPREPLEYRRTQIVAGEAFYELVTPAIEPRG